MSVPPRLDPSAPINVADVSSYEGSSSFRCGGRLVTGPDRLVFWLASLLLLALGVICIVGVFPNIFGGDIMPIAWAAIFIGLEVALWLLSFFFMFRAANMDPGIIPRQAPTSWKLPPTVSVRVRFRSCTALTSQVNGMPVVVKWCDTCNLYRPPRASHCRICNNCVCVSSLGSPGRFLLEAHALSTRWDHHCPWLGNCIGERNYKSFVSLQITFFFLCLLGIPHMIWFLTNRSIAAGSFEAGFFAQPFPFVAAIIVTFFQILAILLVGILLQHTISLICSGLTTNEAAKHPDLVEFNPFDEGCAGNWRTVFCNPTSKRLYIRNPPLSGPVEVHVDMEKTAEKVASPEKNEEESEDDTSSNADEDVESEEAGKDGDVETMTHSDEVTR